MTAATSVALTKERSGKWLQGWHYVIKSTSTIQASGLLVIQEKSIPITPDITVGDSITRQLIQS